MWDIKRREQFWDIEEFWKQGYKCATREKQKHKNTKTGQMGNFDQTLVGYNTGDTPQ